MSDIPDWIGKLGDSIEKAAKHFAWVIGNLFRVEPHYEVEMTASDDFEHDNEAAEIQVTVRFDDTKIDMGPLEDSEGGDGSEQ